MNAGDRGTRSVEGRGMRGGGNRDNAEVGLGLEEQKKKCR